MSENAERFVNLPFVDGVPWKCGPGTGRFTGQTVTVHLEHLEERLVEWLSCQVAVVGCVAWLTSERVLEALNSLPVCQVVMQKEDWMRPDFRGAHPARSSPHLYQANAGFDRHSLDLTSTLSYLGDPSVQRFRCIGQSVDREGRAVMHHKFLVGCASTIEPGESPDEVERLLLEGRSVWVGSFNMTRDAAGNLDSALVLGPEPAGLYFREWVDVFARSEELNFEHEYAVPEWRVGS